ncbi:hypothetical protein AWH61_08070 [Alteromonas sp. W12]|uniref:AAA family ATPase n=1 Tax=Alteromonas sp. W12 TaxID=1772289 RepID=UPI0009490947|nr:AAA family ATPase [Alteromonas sp. W12]OLF76873.1 hypothetical protein AWH61_08070 [Alteromonas sp. W12]
MAYPLNAIIPTKYNTASFVFEGDKVPFTRWLLDTEKLMPFLMMQALHLATLRRITLKLECEFYIKGESAFLLQGKMPELSALPAFERSTLQRLLKEAATDLLDTFFPVDNAGKSDTPLSLKLFLLSYSHFLFEHYSDGEVVTTSGVIHYLFGGRPFNTYKQALNLSHFLPDSPLNGKQFQNRHKDNTENSNGEHNIAPIMPTMKQILCSPSVALKPLINRLQLIAKASKKDKPIDDTALLAAFMMVKSVRDTFKAMMGVKHDIIAPLAVNQLLQLLTESVDMQLCCSGEDDGKSWFATRLPDVTPAHFTQSAANLLQQCCEYDGTTDSTSLSNHAISELCENNRVNTSSIFSEFVTFNFQFNESKEKRCLLSLVKSQMEADVVGQPTVKKALLSSLRQQLDGVPKEQRGPVFIYGASGVGKTSLARSFAKSLNVHLADSYELQVINMEQFYHKNAALQLFGAGFQFNAANLGTLTTPGEFIPKRIIVFDEIEKAHANTINALLTLLSEHQAKDASSNRMVDFSECIFIFTSNVGEQSRTNGFATDYRSELATTFSPEFINRISRGSVAKATPLKESEVASLATQLAYDLALEFNADIDGDIAKAICHLAGELNPRAMLGAVARLRAEIRDELDKSFIDNWESIQKLIIEFDSNAINDTVESLSTFIHRHYSRVWQSSLSLQSESGDDGMVLRLTCKATKPLISLADRQTPFMHFVSDTNCHYHDLIGNREAIGNIQQMVSMLNARCHYTNLSQTKPSHTLLVGKPGTGKTHLARAIANDFEGVFIHVNASELTIGDTDKNLKTLFTAARKYAPSIVFIDEIDAIAAKRHPNTKTNNMMVNSLLTGLDGFDTNTDAVLVVGATNHPDYIDDAVVRAGRMSNRLTLNFPTQTELTAYLKSKIKEEELTPHSADILRAIAGKLQYHPVAMVDTILHNALATTNKHGNIVHALITAFINQIEGEPEAECDRNDSQARRCAYHEAGHALIIAELYTPEDVLAIDICKRANTEGVVLFSDLQGKYGITRATIKKQLQVLLAGRAAEQVLLNDAEQLSRGDALDIRKATELAKKAISQWGLGGFSDMVDKSQFSMSEAELLDEVHVWMKDAFDKAFEICKKKQSELARLSTALLAQHTLYYSDIQRLLMPKCVNHVH